MVFDLQSKRISERVLIDSAVGWSFERRRFRSRRVSRFLFYAGDALPCFVMVLILSSEGEDQGRLLVQAQVGRFFLIW